MSAAENIADRIEEDRALYAAAYWRGWQDRDAQAIADGPVHPAVADSVARIFHGWDGAEAAHAQSAAHFREWHAKARARDMEGVTALADAA